VIVIWVDDAADSCRVAPITTSRVVTPRFNLAPSMAHSAVGAVGPAVSRVPVAHLAIRPAVGSVPADEFDRIVAWLRKEIDL
jgi:hypothetical protein